MSWMRGAVKAVAVVGILGAVKTLSGCAAPPAAAGSTACSAYVQTDPAVATANHNSISPGNQAQFIAASGETCTSGGVPAVLARQYASWANPDPIDIQISSALDATNGTAVCKGPTSGAVTLTGTVTLNAKAYVNTVQLTCQ